ncbi:uncharacterized protein [Miscanthus floridulus]|uniref:uncharacterized protein n=1 Tax=Miscanthus floridulus TaxID=154761 RepID=UPI0034578143
MTKGQSSRASWSFNYEKGLLDVLQEHNHERFKGQNGWSPEGWRSIIKHFNEKFLAAGFSKAQIQDKEKDIKGYYKAIRAGIKESGVGWNDSLCMINASPDKWKKLIDDHPRLQKFQAKAFPLYHECEKVYEGSIATGELNFTSTEPLELHPPSSTQHVNASDIDAPDSSMNPFSASMDDHRASSEPIDLTRAEPTSFACSGQKGSGSGEKRSIAGVLQGYLDHKIKQSKTFVESLDETSKGDYSIKKCMDLLESMEELSDEEKAQATSVMKCEV